MATVGVPPREKCHEVPSRYTAYLIFEASLLYLYQVLYLKSLRFTSITSCEPADTDDTTSPQENRMCTILPIHHANKYTVDRLMLGFWLLYFPMVLREAVIFCTPKDINGMRLTRRLKKISWMVFTTAFACFHIGFIRDGPGNKLLAQTQLGVPLVLICVMHFLSIIEYALGLIWTALNPEAYDRLDSVINFLCSAYSLLVTSMYACNLIDLELIDLSYEVQHIVFNLTPLIVFCRFSRGHQGHQLV